jgi:hypothetical protein
MAFSFVSNADCIRIFVLSMIGSHSQENGISHLMEAACFNRFAAAEFSKQSDPLDRSLFLENQVFYKGPARHGFPG